MIGNPLDLFNLPEWIGDSLCSKVGRAEDWFPAPGASPAELAETVAVCNACPVRLKCLQWALDLERREDDMPLGKWSRHGIYGGLTPNQRHKLAGGTDHDDTAPVADVIECGTVGGFTAHYRRKETPCDPCRQTRNAYENERRKIRRRGAA